MQCRQFIQSTGMSTGTWTTSTDTYTCTLALCTGMVLPVLVLVCCVLDTRLQQAITSNTYR